jgi:hypothetical protein
VIVLKGPALTVEIYPHLGLRSFGDIDFLIHKDDLFQIKQILHDLNYRSYGRLLRPGAEDFHGALSFTSKDSGITIEPHWTLGPPYPYAMREGSI